MESYLVEGSARDRSQYCLAIAPTGGDALSLLTSNLYDEDNVFILFAAYARPSAQSSLP